MQHYAQVIHLARKANLDRDLDRAVLFYDLDELARRVAFLQEVFPSNTMHATPVKTNPIFGILDFIKSQGNGFECASLEEMYLASKTNVPTNQLVYDSPFKTMDEIEYCAQNFSNCLINANHLIEFQSLSTVSHINIGLRINPLIQTSQNPLLQTANGNSKFGEPISNAKHIIEMLINCGRDNLTLHIHAGSEADDVDKIAHSIYLIYALAEQINQIKPECITQIDIGGGLSSIGHQEDYALMTSLFDKISALCPRLFQKYNVITEFGKWLYSRCGWSWSSFDIHNDHLIIHMGADAFVRKIYQNPGPQYNFVLCNNDGQPISGEYSKYNIQGPLCFGGDKIAGEVLLPKPTKEDRLIIENCGANTFGLWSRHCSRRMPMVIGYSLTSQSIKVLKERENLEDIADFWT